MKAAERANMYYTPGFGWQWPDGSRVYQEDDLIPGTVLPIGYFDYGKYISPLRLDSGTEGFWVRDRLSSFHRMPFKTEEAAQAYLDYLKVNH